MPFSYDRLWKKAIDEKLNKTQLRDKVGISNGSLAKLSKNEPVSMEVLGKICKKLHCNIYDVVEYIDNDEREKEKSGEKKWSD